MYQAFLHPAWPIDLAGFDESSDLILKLTNSILCLLLFFIHITLPLTTNLHHKVRIIA